MYQRPSDLYAQLLRPVEVRTRHAALFRFYDTFSVSDSYDFVSKAHSAGVASDSVVVVLRYGIDCFFGGLSFGGSPFGGRIV